MKQAFLNHSIRFIEKYNPNYTQDDIEKLAYGLEGIYLTITKIVIILTVSFLLNILKETVLLLLFVNIIRFTGFGFHAGKSIECLFFSSLLFLGFPFLCKYTIIPLTIQLLIASTCTILFIIYAPADTVKRPLTNRKKRILRKVGTILISIIYTSTVFFIKDQILVNILIASLMIQAIVILPITYQIFHQPYANYKKINSI